MPIVAVLTCELRPKAVEFEAQDAEGERVDMVEFEFVDITCVAPDVAEDDEEEDEDKR